MYPVTLPEPALKREIPAYFKACSIMHGVAEVLRLLSTDLEITLPALFTVIVTTTVPAELYPHV